VIEWLQGVLAAVDGLGTIGYVLFWIAYVLATILLIPEWIFTAMAGVLFGMVWGSLVSWSAASMGAVLAFLLTRIALRRRVEKLVEKNRWMKAINRALPKEGWKVVALTRLSPLVPFGLQNYLFGVTKVRRRDYVVATVLAILPGTIAWVFIGATGRALLGGGGTLKWALFVGGLAATVVLSLFLGRLAKRRLGVDER
jgi:uncharacterized membrane protein YdjX (TVP38/TMEM64 family)